MVTRDGTPVNVGDPGQWIVAIYVFSGCVSPLNFVVTMQDVIAGMVTCLIAQIIFQSSAMGLSENAPIPKSS